MSNGRTHAAVAGVALVATVIATPFVANGVGIDIAAGLVIGAMAGFLATPDLDLECTTHEEIRVFRHCGRMIGRFYVWFWMSYARHHSHRGSSHRPFVGTAGRWWHVWLHTLFLPVLLVLVDPKLAIAAFIANSIQDILHLVFDNWHYHAEG